MITDGNQIDYILPSNEIPFNMYEYLYHVELLPLNRVLTLPSAHCNAHMTMHLFILHARIVSMNIYISVCV